MRRYSLLLFFGLVASQAWAQFTTVSGTVIDPNGIPYARGTIVPVLVSSASPTLNGFQYSPPAGPVGLDLTGSFTMNLANQASLSPGGTTWSFNVCSASGTVQPSNGTGPQCFVVTGVVIAGASQSLSTTLNAAAKALTVGSGSNAVITNPVAGQTINSAASQGITFTNNFPCTSLDNSTQTNAGCGAMYNSFILKSASSTANNLRKALSIYYEGNMQQGNDIFGLQIDANALLDANSVATGTVYGIDVNTIVSGSNVTVQELRGVSSRPRIYNGAHITKLSYFHGAGNLAIPPGTTVDQAYGVDLGIGGGGTITASAAFQDDVVSAYNFGILAAGATAAIVADDTSSARSAICHGAQGAATATLHDCWQSAVTFATLPALNNGSLIYCSDCNATCTAGAGTGRMCFRENGAWTH